MIKPLNKNIVVEEFEEQNSNSPIFIPDAAKEKSQLARVVAVKEPSEIKVNDKVVISKYGGMEIEYDGKQYKIVSEEDVLGVIE